MTKPTSYELLKDTYSEIRALRMEMVQRFEKVEARVDILEDFKGKILGMAAVVSAFVGLASAWIWRKIVGE